MSKGTILYVGNFDKPDASAAGKRVYGNALVFAELGYRIILIGKSKQGSVDQAARYFGGKIEFYTFPDYGMLKTDKYVKWINTFCEKLCISPVAIIRYGSPALACFDYQLYRYASKRNIPIISDVVDWLSVDGGSLIFKIVKTLDTYLEKAFFNKLGNGVICISTWLQNYYNKSGKKTIVLPPLVERYLEPAEPNDTVQVVYAGVPFRKGGRIKNVHKIKDRLDSTVQVFAHLSEIRSDFQLHIYGISADEYLMAFPEQNDLLQKAEKSIIFHGMQPMSIVQEAVRRADFTVLLREKNRATMAGFPTKVVESMSMGTPVITTVTSDLTKHIVTAKTGFFVQLNGEKAIEKQLSEILDCSAEEREIMKMNCIQQKTFMYDVYTSAVNDFFLQIIPGID